MILSTKKLILCCMFIATIIGISACNKPDGPIRIGIAGTMTGINSDLSVSGRRGVELAVHDINEAGGINGRKVELVVKDDKNDIATALKIDKEFIDEKISLVIGHYTSGMMTNSLNNLKDEDILFLSPTASSDALSGKDDNLIRFIPGTKEQALELSKAANMMDAKNFAIAYDSGNKAFCEVLYNNFKQLLKNNGGKVILARAFESKVKKSFSNLAREIAQSKPDGLLIIANSIDNAELTQQIRKIGCKVQIYAPLWSNTIDLVKKGGDSVNGMFVLGAIDVNNQDSDFIRFKKMYVDTYGEQPTFSSLYSYEAVQALFMAMKIGPDLEPDTIKNNIIKIKSFKGLEGKYGIDKFGDIDRELMIFSVENGKLRKVD